MQTSPWVLVPQQRSDRGGWWAAVGWYAAGFAVPVATWMLVLAVTQAVPAASPLTSRAVIVIAIAGAVLWSLRLRARHRIAWWLGIATPVALVAIAIGIFLLMLANDPNAFTF